MKANVGTLLRYQWKLWRNQWRPDSRHRGHVLAAAFILPTFLIALFFASLYFLRWSGLMELHALGMLAPIAQQAASELTLEVLSISSTTTLIVISLGALQQAFETFYLGPDLSLLLSSPLSRQVIFAFKFLMNMRWDAVMVLVTAVPIWLAFAVSMRAPLVFYLGFLVGWLGLLVFVSGMGVTLTMLLVRFIPMSRFRQLMLSSFLTVALVFVAAVQSLATGVWNRDSIVRLLERRVLEQQIWLPSVWLSRGLVYFMMGSVQQAWPWLVALSAGAAIMFALAYLASARLYSVGWSSAQSMEGGRSSKRSTRVGCPVTPVWALVRKDMLFFFRQPMQWYQAALSTVAIVIVLTSFVGQQRDAASALVLSLVMGYVGASTFAMNLSLRCITKEGLSWWILQTSPLAEASILRAKFLAAFIPTSLYACLALGGMQAVLRLPWFVFMLSLPVMLMMVVGMIVLDIAVGIWRADLQQAVETRNADVIAVLVSQILNYLLLTPMLLLLGVAALWGRGVALPRLWLLVFALGVAILPSSALAVVIARHYSLDALRALRLSESAPPFGLSWLKAIYRPKTPEHSA